MAKPTNQDLREEYKREREENTSDGTLETMQPEGIGLLTAIKRTWRDLTGAPDRAPEGTPDRAADRHNHL